MGAREEDLYCDPNACFHQGGVGIFRLIFLSHFLTKMRSFCAHQKGNFLNFSKLTLLLFMVHFWYPLWPVKHKGAFFLRHPVFCLLIFFSLINVPFLFVYRSEYPVRTPLVRLLFCLMAILMILWDFMLLITMLYFHKTIEKGKCCQC